MVSYLYPRIRRPVATRLAEQHAALPPGQLLEHSHCSHPNQFFTPTGGTKVSTEHLVQLRDAVRAIAAEYGYPKGRNQEGTLRFDRRCARLLHERMAITPTEAARAEMWSFFGCVLLSDIVAWRFFAVNDRKTSTERFMGGGRNTFQRLWWRACILHEPEGGERAYQLLDELREDELVQIMERTNLMGNPSLSRAMACTLIQTAIDRGISQRMNLMREAIKRVRRLLSTVMLEAVHPDDLQAHVERIFVQAADALMD